jgi:arabinose-5-phosphate isomerase
MKHINIVNEVRSIVSFQAASLKEARKFIGPSYQKAVEMIFHCKGKIIVTGVGKSGVIAQKMASTLSSTGTPAIYLHPVEGMHGNVGIVRRDDVVFAIGKSGESEEILNILPVLKKIGAKVIALTAKKESSLARQANLTLHMPVEKEACPLNLAPTTSSMISLVIGDAIAIALMKLRGFGPENFALFHPGGLLGKRLLLLVSDVMRSGKRNPLVNITDSMERLLIEISQKWTGAASVVDKKGKFLGLVTDYDIRKAFANGKTMSELTVRDVMNARPTLIYADEKAVKALQIMESRQKPLTVLPVIDRHHKSVGMLHLHDLVTKGLTQLS